MYGVAAGGRSEILCAAEHEANQLPMSWRGYAKHIFGEKSRLAEALFWFEKCD